MKIEEIIQTHELLAQQLKHAAATMNKKDDLLEIRNKIIENQMRCPHFDNNFNWAIVDDICPYCGKKMTSDDIVTGE